MKKCDSNRDCSTRYHCALLLWAVSCFSVLVSSTRRRPCSLYIIGRSDVFLATTNFLNLFSNFFIYYIIINNNNITFIYDKMKCEASGGGSSSECLVFICRPILWV